ncbi:MAG: hypothetical protein L0216_01065 [Planctomycetales bacterium]|nr:hypothetical protein [Planctomycetales bacterium]
MRKMSWLMAVAAAAGCGGKGPEAGPAKPPETAKAGPGATKGADPTLPKAAPAPEKTVGVAAFVESPGTHAGRIGIEGAVFSVDAEGSRFLICDLAEAGCIGGDC